MSVELPAPLAILARADSVVLERFGVAALETAELFAYREALGCASRYADALQWMLVHATPAGKLYAALLVAQLDAASARSAWALLEPESAVVDVHPGGCTFHRAPLGHFAISMRLAGNLYSALPPWRDPSLPAQREPRDVPARGVVDRAVDWFEDHRGRIALVFWLVAGSVYLGWLAFR